MDSAHEARSVPPCSTPFPGCNPCVCCTADGNTFTVDAAAGGVDAVPAAYREEVAAKLRAIQQLATAALGSRV